jgi:exonuclease VII large subunit
VDIVDGEARRLLNRINMVADTIVGDLTGGLLEQLDRWLDSRDRRTSADELERQGLAFADRAVTASVENWRVSQAAQLQQDLESLDARLRGDLQRATDDLRQAAAELLELNLHVTPATTRLAPSPRFHYVPPGSTWGAPGLTRRLSGFSSRRRIIQRLHEQVRELVSKHIGRARADLQQRLQETTRQFIAQLTTRYDDHAARLHAGLDAAAQLNDLAAAGSAVLRAELGVRLGSLEAVVCVLATWSQRSRDLADEHGQPAVDRDSA